MPRAGDTLHTFTTATTMTDSYATNSWGWASSPRRSISATRDQAKASPFAHGAGLPKASPQPNWQPTRAGARPGNSAVVLPSRKRATEARGVPAKNGPGRPTRFGKKEK